MLPKSAYIVIHLFTVAWIIYAGLYTYKTALKDILGLKRLKQG